MSTKSRILLIEDEDDIRELIQYNLSKSGFEITACESGEDGLLALSKDQFDLIILDIMLPGMDGLEVCRKVKEDKFFKTIPILMLSAKGEESDIVVGLELGADDYLTKPFSPKILIARINAALRRKGEKIVSNQLSLSLGGIEIDPGKFEVKVNGLLVEMTASEFKILHLLMMRRGWVFTRSQIVDLVKGEDYPVTERSVDVQIVGIRKKLGNLGDLVETVRGVGYKFKES